MRSTTWTLCAAALALLPGCGLILDIDSLQHGDAGAHDAAVPADGASDGGRDAGVDARVPDAGPLDTGPLDTGTPETGMPDTGAGGDAGPDAFAGDGGLDAGATYGVSGVVVGLASGTSITLSNGSDALVTTGAGGSTPFSFRVAMGASYDVEVTDAPATLVCIVYRGTGTASADVGGVFVGCSTAVDLVSYFPFDGDVHASRGSDWTTATGSVSYVADRLGRASHALAPTSGTTIRLAWPLNGDSTTAAPHSAQFTLAFWVRVPASASTSGAALIGHGGPTALSAEAQVNFRGGLPYADLYFYWDGGFDRVLTMSTTSLGRDTWHHVAFSASGPSSSTVFDFDRVVYVDGVREGSTTTCCGWGNFTQWWDLDVSPYERDDLRLYRRMLTDAEVAGIYAAEHVP